MMTQLTARQQEIIAVFRKKDGGLNSSVFQKLERQQLELNDIEILCSLINNEYMMEGILPNFEPNPYGVELERLLDAINRPRVEQSTPTT